MGFKYSIPKRKKGNVEYSQKDLYIEYYPIIMKLIMVKGRDVHDAEDIAHDTFEWVYQIWDRIRWEHLERLLSLVLYQSVVRFYRQFDNDDNKTSNSTYVEMIDKHLVSDPVDSMVNGDFRDTLKKGLMSLSKSEQEVFYGFYLEDLSVNDLMTKHNRKMGTVVSLLYRARNKMVLFFEENYK